MLTNCEKNAQTPSPKQILCVCAFMNFSFPLITLFLIKSVVNLTTLS